ncbi:MAG: hypothetical protein ACFB6R_05110 [Alphaproteobacteria bacterium]
MSFDSGDPKTRSKKPDPRERALALRREAADYLRRLRAERAAKRRASLTDDLADDLADDPAGDPTPADERSANPAPLPAQFNSSSPEDDGSEHGGNAAPSASDPSPPSEPDPRPRVRVFERWQPMGAMPRSAPGDDPRRAAAEARRRETAARRTAVRETLLRTGEARRSALRPPEAAGISDPMETGPRPLRRGPRTARAVAASRADMANRAAAIDLDDAPDGPGGSLFGALMTEDQADQGPLPTMPFSHSETDAMPAPEIVSGADGPHQGSGVWINPDAFQTTPEPVIDPPAPAETDSVQVDPADAPGDDHGAGEGNPSLTEAAHGAAVTDLGAALQVRMVRTPVPLDALPMIGAGMRTRLHQLGVETVQALAEADPVALKASLGNVSCLANVDVWIETARIFIHGPDPSAAEAGPIEVTNR